MIKLQLHSETFSYLFLTFSHFPAPSSFGDDFQTKRFSDCSITLHCTNKRSVPFTFRFGSGNRKKRDKSKFYVSFAERVFWLADPRDLLNSIKDEKFCLARLFNSASLCNTVRVQCRKIDKMIKFIVSLWFCQFS